MVRLMTRSFLVLAMVALFASVSMAQSRGGRGPSGGSANNVLPTTSTTKVIPTRDAKTTRVVDNKSDKVIETRVSRVIETRVTQVIDTKVAKVINTKYTDVIDTKVINTKYTDVIDTKVITTKVVVTKVIPGQVIVNPISGGFGWGGCGCDCYWITEIFRVFGYEPPAVPVQTERFLRLHNDTDQKVKVFLRFHTEDVSNKWEWIPEAPGPNASKWVAFEMEPNEILEPKLGDMPIAANRIRLYAESATRSWKNYQDQDYWLVPEITTAGEHLYYAPTRETYQFYIHNNTK